jgi:hypothetical protein
MSDKEITEQLVKLQREIAAIWRDSGLCGIDDQGVHLAEEHYRQIILPVDSGQVCEREGRFVRVSCRIQGVQFFSLFEPKIHGSLQEMVGIPLDKHCVEVKAEAAKEAL